MAKVLRLRNAGEAASIDGVNPGSIVESTDINGETIDKVALEINENTGERAVVPFENLLVINGHAIFAANLSVVEL